jgi:FixJ family two-component response regulator
MRWLEEHAMDRQKMVAVVDDDKSVRESLRDANLPGMSGPELERELIRRGQAIPTIFITAQSQESILPGLLGQGAIECLYKPFSREDLRAALDAALAKICIGLA